MAALQTFGRSALRVTKNYSKGYSHAQIKTRNATCNDPWPPSGKEMYELAQMTYNQGEFVDIMQVIDKRMNDKGKNWRHVFKALTVLDYLLHSGSENVILYCERNLYVIKTLREFQHIDDEERDQGANVRQKAKDITNMILDKQRLFRERAARAKMHGRSSGETDDGAPALPPRPRRRELRDGAQRAAEDEEDELRRAIEESRRSAAMERATAEDLDLARAIKMSEEEAERQKKLAEQSSAPLFDQGQQQAPAPAAQPLIDATLPLQVAAPMQPQYTSIQPQSTSFQPQFAPLQPQFTSIQPQFTYVQPQFTSYNPYAQQAQHEVMQAEYMRQQQQLQAQHTAAAQQVAPASFSPIPFSPLPQQQQQQPLVPQPTALGSNNPFAPLAPRITANNPFAPPSLRARSAPHPSTSSSAAMPPRERDVSFSIPEREREERRGDEQAVLRPFSTGSQPPRRRVRESEDARLAGLFASYTGDGVDTFGNVGQLRLGARGGVPAQKTGGGNLVDI